MSTAYTIDELLTFFEGEFTEEQIRQHLARGSGGTELAKDHQEALRDFFERCGPIHSARLFRDPSGRSRGCGQVRFRSPSSAAHALREVLELGGRVLQVRRFRPGKERPTEREVFVESLSWHTKEEHLRRHFEDCGEIVSCQVFYKKNGEPKGCGRLLFRTVEAAQTAATKHLSDLDGWTLAVRPALPATPPMVTPVAFHPGVFQLEGTREKLMERMPALELNDWLQLLDPKGFLLRYLPLMMAQGHRTVRDVAERYLESDRDRAEIRPTRLDPRLFEDLKIRKLGHRRLVQRWFADLDRFEKQKRRGPQ
ncbi:unnamed protein product [Durusdinium trenchii]|uniref:RRM domain-containing protein n=1 Tax=Durusdinium trenchii TaxID=1381693 RepID=A0ABP0R4I2_9DINO